MVETLSPWCPRRSPATQTSISNRLDFADAYLVASAERTGIGFAARRAARPRGRQPIDGPPGAAGGASTTVSVPPYMPIEQV